MSETPKSGARALGVAESYAGTAEDGARSVLGGSVVRADRVVDGFGFETCTVGGTDATDAVRSLVGALNRDDIQYLFLAGVAPAWFNLVDVRAIARRTELPTVAVTFEDSAGLESVLRDNFDGDALAARLDTYRALPPRTPVTVDGGRELFVRAAGIDAADAAGVVRAYTTDGRPEPLRVARLAARAARRFREDI